MKKFILLLLLLFSTVSFSQTFDFDSTALQYSQPQNTTTYILPPVYDWSISTYYWKYYYWAGWYISPSPYFYSSYWYFNQYPYYPYWYHHSYHNYGYNWHHNHHGYYGKRYNYNQPRNGNYKYQRPVQPQQPKYQSAPQKYDRHERNPNSYMPPYYRQPKNHEEYMRPPQRVAPERYSAPQQRSQPQKVQPQMRQSPSPQRSSGGRR